MFYPIISLLLEVLTGLIGGACLLRLYMQFQRIPMSSRSGNPLGSFIFALTDWLVLPLRKIVPPLGRWDLASLVAVLLLEFLQFLVLWLLAGGHSGLGSLAILAVFGVVRMTLSGMTGLVIVYALLSWMPSRSPMADLIDRLCAPLLAPVRRYVPLVGGIDLSTLALLVLLQVASIVVGQLQGWVLMLG